MGGPGPGPASAPHVRDGVGRLGQPRRVAGGPGLGNPVAGSVDEDGGGERAGGGEGGCPQAILDPGRCRGGGPSRPPPPGRSAANDAVISPALQPKSPPRWLAAASISVAAARLPPPPAPFPRGDAYDAVGAPRMQPPFSFSPRASDENSSGVPSSPPQPPTPLRSATHNASEQHPWSLRRYLRHRCRCHPDARVVAAAPTGRKSIASASAPASAPRSAATRGCERRGGDPVDKFPRLQHCCSATFVRRWQLFEQRKEDGARSSVGHILTLLSRGAIAVCGRL